MILLNKKRYEHYLQPKSRNDLFCQSKRLYEVLISKVQLNKLNKEIESENIPRKKQLNNSQWANYLHTIGKVLKAQYKHFRSLNTCLNWLLNLKNFEITLLSMDKLIDMMK
jgi:galactokinase